MKQSNENTTTCKCDYCHCDIPLSSALSSEGAEYTFYFCGSDCLKKWQKQNEQHDSGD